MELVYDHRLNVPEQRPRIRSTRDEHDLDRRYVGFAPLSASLAAAMSKLARFVDALPARLAATPHPLFLQRTLVSPKTGENRRTSRPHLALRGTRRPLHVRVHARSKDLWDRHVVPSSPAPARRPRTTSGVGELQWPPEDGENVTNRTVNAPLKTGQNAEIGNAAVRAASGERAARARLPITVIDRQSLGEALAWWRKSYAT